MCSLQGLQITQKVHYRKIKAITSSRECYCLHFGLKTGLYWTLEKAMGTHSSILSWRIPGTEEPGGRQSMGSQESNTTQQLNHHQHHTAHTAFPHSQISLTSAHIIENSPATSFPMTEWTRFSICWLEENASISQVLTWLRDVDNNCLPLCGSRALFIWSANIYLASAI